MIIHRRRINHPRLHSRTRQELPMAHAYVLTSIYPWTDYPWIPERGLSLIQGISPWRSEGGV